MIQFRNARRRPRGKGGGGNFLNKMQEWRGKLTRPRAADAPAGPATEGAEAEASHPAIGGLRRPPRRVPFLSGEVRFRILGDGERGQPLPRWFRGTRPAMGNGNVFPPSASFSRHFCSCGGPQCLVQRARQKLKFTPHWPLVKISWAQIHHFPLVVYESCRISFRIWQIFKQKFCVRVQASWKWVRNPQI